MIRRGQIYYAALDPVKGREQAGRRPVLVVSADAINKLPLVVTVIVGTDGANVPNDYSTNIRVPAGESGLPLETVFMAFQIRALDPGRLHDPRSGRLALAGILGEARMGEVDQALRKTLAL